MKNIILLITDTYRYDNLGDRAVAMPVRTPELDRFRHEHAAEIHGFYTGSFPTIPHRTDVATGRVGWPRYGWQSIERSSGNHVAALLGKEGYATQLICDCPHLFNANFNSAFNAAFQHRGQEGDRPLLRLDEPIIEIMPPDKTRQRPSFRGHPLVDVHRWTNRYSSSELDKFPARTGTTVVRWLEENRNASPFFLWVDFFDPHEPWDAPEYMVRRYDPDYSGPPMMHPNYGRTDAYTSSELRNLRAHYAAEAELVDRWLGRVLQKIDDLELWDDTVVVVTSDHGMSLGEHGRTGKSNISDDDSRYWPIYPEIAHVPFLVAAPDVPAGASLELLAQPCDLLPTVCELAGAEPAAPEPFHGRSFAPALRHGSGTHRTQVVSGCFLRPDAARGVPRRASTPFVVSSDGWGYAPVGARGTPELYALNEDPLAENDLAVAHPDRVAAMHKRFLEYLRQFAPEEWIAACWGAAPRLDTGGSWAVDY
ncbi:MAG: sulfatase [Kiritimatiellaeota bacterium]|nr:sulfatase [Kiritimatiellota bacterium]